MKSIFCLIILLSGLHLCVAQKTPLSEPPAIHVVNVDSVYQRQMVEMSGQIQAMKCKLDSIGAVNRDLLFSRELYSDLISTQLCWFGFFLIVVTLMFGWINFRSVFSRLKEYKKEQEVYQVSMNSKIDNQSTVLESKFNKLIETQKTEFKEEMKKLDKNIITAKISAFRGMYFEAKRQRRHDASLRFAIYVLMEIVKQEYFKKTTLQTWINISEAEAKLITDSFSEDDYDGINDSLKEILDCIDDEYKERIKSLQENINIKYYSLLPKAKEENPKG